MFGDLLRLLLLLAGLLGILVSAAIVVQSEVNVRAARRMARILLAGTMAIPFFVLVSLVLEPGGPTPMFDAWPWYAELLPWVGAAAYVMGLAWMIQIYRRAHLEPDASYWRYRD